MRTLRLLATTLIDRDVTLHTLAEDGFYVRQRTDKVRASANNHAHETTGRG